MMMMNDIHRRISMKLMMFDNETTMNFDNVRDNSDLFVEDLNRRMYSLNKHVHVDHSKNES